jgi:putative ABC transport system permease protein
MNFVAMQMLRRDRVKYLGLIMAVAFSTFLMSNQSSIFAGIMNRSRSQILDIQDADIWVMDPRTQYFDEVKALPDDVLYRVRGVEGVEWAVPLYKGQAIARSGDGNFRSVLLIGVDDHSLVGAPRRLLAGSIAALRQPDAVLIDYAAYAFFFPGQPVETGKTFELNDHRTTVAGVFDSSAPFNNLPVFYARYGNAIRYRGQERNMMSFVLAKAKNGLSDREACRRIEAATGLHAATKDEFGWQTIWYYMKHSGIPVNFGITIAIGLLVGTLVAGQTLYLFTIENLKQFGVLKAVGVTNWRIVRMILLQSATVGAIGYSIGILATAAFFEITGKTIDLRGFYLLWQIAAGTAAAMLMIVMLASLMSIRKALVLEPAMVFRG